MWQQSVTGRAIMTGHQDQQTATSRSHGGVALWAQIRALLPLPYVLYLDSQHRPRMARGTQRVSSIPHGRAVCLKQIAHSLGLSVVICLALKAAAHDASQPSLCSSPAAGHRSTGYYPDQPQMTKKSPLISQLRAPQQQQLQHLALADRLPKQQPAWHCKVRRLLLAPGWQVWRPHRTRTVGRRPGGLP